MKDKNLNDKGLSDESLSDESLNDESLSDRHLPGLKGISSLQDLSERVSLEGKRVFLRLDLNTPLENAKITDSTRIRAALPTLRFLLDKGAKLVIASHLGRPKTDADMKSLSLEPVAQRLGELLKLEVFLVEEALGLVPKELLKGLKSQQVVMLENLRFTPQEKQNSSEMASIISSYIDIYVNDAFGVCHREHTSVCALSQMVKERAAGFLIFKEVEMLNSVLYDSQPPFVVILGGAKVSDKISVFESLMEKVDTFIVGGAMAYTFLKAKGVEVGDSLVEKNYISFAKQMIRALEVRKKKLLLPIDHLVIKKADFEKANNTTVSILYTKGEAIEKGYMGLDIGPESQKKFAEQIAEAQTVFWNGPMGMFEKEEFCHGTFSIARTLAQCSGTTVVGGGDSVAATFAAGVADKMTHISTGGGASLKYLQGSQLPGLEALRESKREGVTPAL